MEAPNLYLFDSTLRELQMRNVNGGGLPVEATPLDFVPRDQQVRSVKDAQEFTYRAGGRAAMPRKPLGLVDQYGTPIFIVGAGLTEAAELEDMALAKLEQSRKRNAIDFDELRAERGLPSREDVWGKGGLFLQAVEDRIKYHKQHQVTDPGYHSSDKFVRGYVNGATFGEDK